LALVALRFTLGALFLALILVVRRERLLPEPCDRARCAGLGLILAVHIGVQTEALRFTSASHAGWLIAAIPVAIALGAHFFFAQRLAPAGWVGVSLAALGVACIQGTSVPGLAEASLGDGLVLSGCVTWALYTLLGARATRSSGSLRVTCFAMQVAAASLLAVVPWQGVLHSSVGALELAALAYLGILSSGVAFSLWALAQVRYGSQRAGAVIFLQPLVTGALSPLFGREGWDRRAFLFGGLVVLGVALAQRGARAAAR
jgi:drug/metabolite transporter (DMT)-like permease